MSKRIPKRLTTAPVEDGLRGRINIDAVWTMTDLLIDELFSRAKDTRLPIDYIEPILEHREASMRYIDVLNGFATYIESGLSEGNLRSVSVRFWQASYAMGLKCCSGMNMTEKALRLGVQPESIARGAQEFVEFHGLSTSFFMRNGNGANGTNE